MSHVAPGEYEKPEHVTRPGIEETETVSRAPKVRRETAANDRVFSATIHSQIPGSASEYRWIHSERPLSPYRVRNRVQTGAGGWGVQMRTKSGMGSSRHSTETSSRSKVSYSRPVGEYTVRAGNQDEPSKSDTRIGLRVSLDTLRTTSQSLPGAKQSANGSRGVGSPNES